MGCASSTPQHYPTQQYDEAAAKCHGILGLDVGLWEQWVFVFAKHRQLDAITPHIPKSNPTLSMAVYEMVLNHFVNTNVAMLRRMLDEWPPHLYNIRTIITTVKQKAAEQRTPPHAVMLLRETLAELYTRHGDYDKALHTYLQLKRGNIFALIRGHDLFTSIADRIPLLMAFNAAEAIDMLVEHVERIPVATVVQQLDDPAHGRWRHAYLDALFRKDAHIGADFHEQQVELYAEYDRPRLLTFLRQSNYYPLEKALDICRRRDLIPEQVRLSVHGTCVRARKAGLCVCVTWL